MRKFQDTVVLFLFAIFLVIINNGKVDSQKYLLVRIQSQDASGHEARHEARPGHGRSMRTQCRTMATGPESDKPCRFPFKYNGKKYFECTTEGYEDVFWCGTTYSVTDHAGWGFCSGPCKPKERRKALISVLNRVLKNGNKGFRKSSPGKKESPKVLPKLKLIPKNETKGVITSRKYIPDSSKKSADGRRSRKQSTFDKKKFRDYDSPLQNRFCSTRKRDLDYEVCSIDCRSSRRGRSCRETIYQKKCGCKEMNRAKRKGVMKYKDGRLLNDQIKSSACEALRRDRCKYCRGRGSGWQMEAYSYGPYSCITPRERCDRFDPSDYWTDYYGRPFGGNIDSDYCYASQANEGTGEKFCQIRCNRDGTCTESVRQHKCSCPDYDDEDYPESEFESNCATVAYKNGKQTAEFGDMNDATVEEMFDEACDNAVHRDRDAVRCSECIEERGSEVSGMSNGFIRDNDYCEFSRRNKNSNERSAPEIKNTVKKGSDEKIIDE